MQRTFVKYSNTKIFLTLFLSGAVLALGFAPHALWPVGFIAIPNLLMGLHTAPTLRSAAVRGFAFGYGYFMSGTWWIANALLVDADKFAWMLPFSVLGLSAVLALWFALLGALARVTLRSHSPLAGESTRLLSASVGGANPASMCGEFPPPKSQRAILTPPQEGSGSSGQLHGSSILRFAILWVAIEYLRSVGIFGFPWNLLGSMAVSVPPVLQLASVVGTFGLSLLLVLLFALPCYFYARVKKTSVWRDSIPVVVIVAAITLYGLHRMPAAAPLTDTRIRIVQGNIPQSQKWTQAGEHEAERIYSELTQAGEAPSIIIWPETAVPVAFYPEAIWPQQLGQWLPKDGMLLTGALRVAPAPDGSKKLLWNSLLAIGRDGNVHAVYDKHQLVPFGEFVPLRETLDLSKITPGDTDFSRGEGVQTLTLAGVPPFSPLICYEVIFPWLAANPSPRPAWLVNITNDAWYGDAPGPYQHLVAAQLRAVEQGLPLVRAANTGISAVIDPYGRVIQLLPLNKRGVIDQNLPAPLPAPPYARYREALPLALMLVLWLLSRRQRKACNR